MSTLGDVQYTWGTMSKYSGGYHECSGGFSTLMGYHKYKRGIS